MSQVQKRVQVRNGSCLVETLSEWVNARMDQLKKAHRTSEFYNEQCNFEGRIAEVGIIIEKINDGRIQEIGKVEFKKSLKENKSNRDLLRAVKIAQKRLSYLDGTPRMGFKHDIEFFKKVIINEEKKS